MIWKFLITGQARIFWIVRRTVPPVGIFNPEEERAAKTVHFHTIIFAD